MKRLSPADCRQLSPAIHTPPKKILLLNWHHPLEFEIRHSHLWRFRGGCLFVRRSRPALDFPSRHSLARATTRPPPAHLAFSKKASMPNKQWRLTEGSG